MSFFGEFDESEFYEAAAPSRSSSASRPTSTSSRPATTSRPAATSRPTSTTTSRPTSTTSSRPTGTTPRPTTTTSRPGGGGASPRPTTTTPSSSPQRPQGQGFSFDQFSRGLQRGLDIFNQGSQIVQQGSQIVQQFTRPGGGQPFGGAPAFGTDTPAPGADPGSAGAALQPPPYDPAAQAQPAGAAPPAPSEPASPLSPFAQFAQPMGVPSPYPMTPPGQPAPGQPGQPSLPPAGLDHFAQLLQALQQRQIPALPGVAPGPTTMAPSPQADGLGLLRVILGNPQFQQALFGTHRAAPARHVALPLPFPGAPHQARSMHVPLGAVMNAIATLAGQSMSELNAETAEAEPDVPAYLVGDDGDFLVDPANPNDRAALVAHLFRLSEALQTAGARSARRNYPTYFESELDESEEFALQTGFGM